MRNRPGPMVGLQADGHFQHVCSWLIICVGRKCQKVCRFVSLFGLTGFEGLKVPANYHFGTVAGIHLAWVC